MINCWFLLQGKKLWPDFIY